MRALLAPVTDATTRVCRRAPLTSTSTTFVAAWGSRSLGPADW